MKIFLTGATGFLGSHIAREVVRAGHTVRVLVRSSSRLTGLEDVPCEKAEGDILSEPSLERAMNGMDAIIHTAGNTSAKKRDRDMIYKVNVEGTKNICEAALKNKIKRVVATSSMVAIGATPTPVIQDEYSPWLVGGHGYHYVDAKRQGEEVALSYASRGLEVINLNPAFMLGPGDVYITSTRLALEYLKGIGRFATGGGVSHCDIRDVAQAHVAALTRGRSGERYIVAGHNITYFESLKILERLTGLSSPIKLPKPMARVIAGVMDVVSLLVKNPYEEINWPVMKYGYWYSYASSAKAQKELGYTIRSLEESFIDTIRDFLKRKMIEPTTELLKKLIS